jgi:3-methyl-2-oxobutanoate hydroxymethyltransferase
MIRPRVTVPQILERKTNSGSTNRITMITAYDATFASIVDESGVDIILVGDSVGSVVQGVATTIPVTLEEMEYHVKLVARAQPRALIVGDLPFGSYQVNSEQGVRSAIRLIKAGASAIKLEGGVNMYDTIAAISRVDIPVMGHIGLTVWVDTEFRVVKTTGMLEEEKEYSKMLILSNKQERLRLCSKEFQDNSHLRSHRRFQFQQSELVLARIAMDRYWYFTTFLV